jgi:hypothetical protein
MNFPTFTHLKSRAVVSVALAWSLVIAIVAFATLRVVPPTPALAADDHSAFTKSITVVGEGKTKIKPDIARVNIGVEVLRPSVLEASKANKEQVDAVLKALTSKGVADKDIQTSGFSVYAERYGSEGPLPEDKVNYRVSNNVTVVIRDLDKLGEILDAAIESGANNIYGVDFSVESPKAAQSEARKLAIDDARAKAEELAKLTGVGVGEVLTVSEIIGSVGYMSANVFPVAQGLGGGGGPAITPGTLEVSVSIQVSYALK